MLALLVVLVGDVRDISTHMGAETGIIPGKQFDACTNT